MTPWLWYLVRDLSVVMEVVAVLLPVLVVGAVVGIVVAAAVLRHPLLLAAAASWTAFAVTAVLLPWLPASTGSPADGVTVAVANVYAGNTRPDDAVADLLAVGAQVLVVPEVNREIHAMLAETYPFAERHPGQYTASLGIYSRLPAEHLPHPEGVFDPRRYSRVRIDGPTPFVLWGLHLPRPWLFPDGNHQMRPGGHARVISRVLDAMAEEALPVVAAGDLNVTDRGRGYRKLTATLDDAMRSIRGGRTSVKASFRPLLLRIDHILQPQGWCADRARRFDITGSDHRGVTARIGPCSPR